MERLTRWIDDQKDIAIESKEATKDECLKRLAEYEDAEEQGRLIKFPVAVGDHVWCFPSKIIVINDLTEMIVMSLEHCTDGNYIHLETINQHFPVCFNLESIGKQVFLSREEAKAKITEMEAKDGQTDKT